MIGKMYSSSAPSVTRMTSSASVFLITSSNCSAKISSDLKPTFICPQMVAISTFFFSSTSELYVEMAEKIALTSESSGSACPSLFAASILFLIPTIGLFTLAFLPKSSSRSTLRTRVFMQFQ